VTGGGSSIPEVQRLLAVLAAGRRVGEAGTAFGEGAAAMAETACSVFTVEHDGERAALAVERLRTFSNVELPSATGRSYCRNAGRSAFSSTMLATSSELHRITATSS
jgi:protein-L-isoaspartate O-methyltransferase